MKSTLVCLVAAATFYPALAAEKPLAFGTLRFEENRGQAQAGVRYIARARGQQIYFRERGVVFAPLNGPPISMEFAGAEKAQWAAAGPATDSISYFVGRDSAKWVRNALVYDRIVWRSVYPGVDATFYADGERLEYDLTIAPGADASLIRVRFGSGASVSTDSGGTASISSGASVIRQRVPAIWQENAMGQRGKIAGRFSATGKSELTLALSAYDRSKAVVVDPVLELATYLGGENDDEVIGLADGVIAGNTRSLAFPGAISSIRPSRDLFLRGTGQAIPGVSSRNVFYGTLIIGGSGDDELSAAGVFTAGNASYYLAGTTTSTDLPGTGQYHGGASDGFLAVITIFNTFNVSANFSYVGGSGEDRINGAAGNGTSVAVAGVTDSSDLPVGDVPQKVLAGGKDAFYGIVYSVFGPYTTYGYLGGTADDAAYAVGFANAFTIWIGGETRSADFPFREGSLAGASDGFLAQVTAPTSFYSQPAPPVSVTVYRVGGSGEDSVRALTLTPYLSANTPYPRPITVDGLGFAGITTSADLPVYNAAQPQFGGDRDAFVGMWDRAASAPRWLSYLGGAGADEALAIAQNWAGDLYVGGWTGSSDLPVVHALQTASAGGQDGMFAVFEYGGALQQLTYFGGTGDDRIRAVAVTANSTARVAGSSTSTDLPQRLPWQARGGRTEGFIAEIGSDYFIGPSSLTVAKDSQLSFGIRQARTSFREPVTYRSSDPSRLRLVYLGRSFEEITAPPEDGIGVEGLDDHGSVDVIVSAPGYSSKTISVNLYPGAFVPSISPGTTPVSTWGGEAFLYSSFYAIDPSTGKPTGFSLQLRNGAPGPVVHWSLSDSSVFRLISEGSGGVPKLQPIRSGDAVVSLSVDGYSVAQADKTVTAVAPHLLPIQPELHVGRDLTIGIPLFFGVNGGTLVNGYRGTLTARSSDPGRLLLSTSPENPGRESVSVTMTNTVPTIFAQSLADDGPVQVLLTSSEFEGEVALPVTLEPTVVKWITPDFSSGADPSVSLKVSSYSTAIYLHFQSESGTTGSLRAGAAPVTFRMSNSAANVLELNRLTVTLGAQNSDSYTILPRASGSSTLTLTSSNDRLRIVPPSIRVDTALPVQVLPSFATRYVGIGLQIPVSFRYSGENPAVTVASDDPSLALVSASASAAGSREVTLATSSGGGEYTFYLQGVKSAGETNVRVTFPSGERAMHVVLLPSGTGFLTPANSSPLKGFDQSVQTVSYALDRETGIGVSQQIPAPGHDIAVRFRADGAPVQLSLATAVLTAASPSVTLSYTLPPAGQRTDVIVKSDNSPFVSPLTNTVKVGAATSTEPISLPNAVMARDELRQISLGAATSGGTAASGDPSRVLLSAKPGETPAASIQIAKGASAFYAYALADSGVVTVRLDMTGSMTPSEVKVALQPLTLSFFSSDLVPLGGRRAFSAGLNASALRPGAGPYRFSARVADASVATVEPETFEIAGEGSTLPVQLQLTGVSAGTTQLIVSGPSDVYILPKPLNVTVQPASASPPVAALTIGRNLQGATQIDLGANFANPNGAIVTLKSSNPDLLLLSRSSTTAGTASVNVAVPAGEHRTQIVYLQAIGLGDAVIGAATTGSSLQDTPVHIVASWVECGSVPVLNPGGAQSIGCAGRYDTGSAVWLQAVEPRAGLSDVTVKLASSAPDIFSVSPAEISLRSNSSSATVQALAAGQGVLQVTPPASFGLSPNVSEGIPVTVTRPALHGNCTSPILAQDSQLTCNIFSANIPVTATSGDSSLLLVSSDPKAVGSTSVTATPTMPSGSGVFFTLQALASFGTVEVVFRAPGYEDLRIPVVLRPSVIYFDFSYQPGSVSVAVGGTATLAVAMRTPEGYALTPRAGAKIGIDFSVDRPGIVTFTPAHLFLDGPGTNTSLELKGAAPGSTLLQLKVPPQFLAGPPVPVSVR